MNKDTVHQDTVRQGSLGQADLQELCRIAEAAGREVMAVYGSDFASWQKDDASPVTHADLRADDVIRRGLEAAWPGVYILSEEGASLPPSPDAQDLPERFFLVDPLDGTREFLQRNGEFTVNIALIEHGVAVAGVVQLPAFGEVFWGARGLGAWKRHGNETVITKTRPVAPGGPLRVLGSRSHNNAAVQAWLARLHQPHDVIVTGSSLKFCRIAEGAADLYPRLGPTHQWDTAAGQAVLESAGGAVLTSHGEPMSYGLGRPILNPHFVAVGDRSLSLPAF